MKIDIKIAFDTLDSNNLIKDFVEFGFDKKFCDLILIIIHAFKLAIMINTKVARLLFFTLNE